MDWCMKMDELPDVALEHIWSFLQNHELLELLGVCRCIRYSIISFVERRGFEVKTSMWRDAYCWHVRILDKRMACWSVMLKNIISSMGKTRSLSISDIDYQPYNREILDIDIVLENCPQLEKLDLCGLGFTPGSIVQTFQQYPQLKELKVPKDISRENLEAIFQTLPALQTLYLGDFELDDDHVALLPSSLECLSCYKYSRALETRVNVSLPNLRVLITRHHTFLPADVSKSNSLIYVDIDNMDDVGPIVPAGIKHIRHVLMEEGQLEAISYNPQLYFQLMSLVLYDIDANLCAEALSRLGRLQHLMLGKIILTEELGTAVSLLKYLKQLAIVDVNFDEIVKSVHRLGVGKREPEPFDSEWAAVFKFAGHIPCIITFAVDCYRLGIIDEPSLSETQFEEAGRCVPKDKKMTLYTCFRVLEDGEDDVVTEVPWSYNCSGRLRVKGLNEAKRDLLEMAKRALPTMSDSGDFLGMC